ncbi:MAG: hypothetical protein IKS45_13040, partial [Thermoguttaceae bacterium]|nr:hypothetical protein [Thermoguttaceae bacterium]
MGMYFCPVCNSNILCISNAEKPAPIGYCGSCNALLGYLWYSDRYVTYEDYLEHFRQQIDACYTFMEKRYNFRSKKYTQLYGSELTSYELLLLVRDKGVPGTLKVLGVGLHPIMSEMIEQVIEELALHIASFRTVRYMENLGIYQDLFLSQAEASFLINFARSYMNEPVNPKHLIAMSEDKLTGKFPYVSYQYADRINSNFSVFEYVNQLPKEKDAPILQGGSFKIADVNESKGIITGENTLYESAALSLLSSPHLESISQRIIEAYEKLRQFSSKSKSLKTRFKDYKNEFFGLKNLLSQYFPIFHEYRQNLQKLQSDITRFDEARKSYSLNMNIQHKKGTETVYNQLFDAFNRLIGTPIWDIIAIDRITSTITVKKPVAFSLQQIPILKCEFTPMHLENANGSDIFIYPGFLVLHEESVAVIDLKEIQFNSRDLPEGLQVDLTTKAGLKESYLIGNK